jgi:hypothetical protein
MGLTVRKQSFLYVQQVGNVNNAQKYLLELHYSQLWLIWSESEWMESDGPIVFNYKSVKRNDTINYV